MEHLIKINNKKDIKGIVNYSDFNVEDYLEFDYYRIVNPLTKEVFYFDESNILKKYNNYKCYEIWGSGRSCDYCVSTNALITSSTKRKLEQINGELYLAKVFPILIDDKKYIVELFQNIGDSYVKTENKNLKLSQLITQMNHLATIESFSGLYSHGFMYNKAMEISRDNILPVSLLCMDIDKMKYVNDTFGHFEGDKLIKNISKELLKLNNDKVFAGRTGGDEFQIFYIGYNEKEALDYSSDVLKNLEKIPVKNNYYSSTSWAIGERKALQTPKEFMETVDAKMYRVKANHHAIRKE
ncbi:MAG: GGDEF domain-containing protein [Pleomorphochaeta sp.]